MAITSSNLTAGKAISGQGGNGKRSTGRVAGLVATAALGLSLLTGVVLGQARPLAQPADPAGVRVNPYWVYTEDVTIASAYPSVVQGAQYPAGTDDQATTGCIGNTGPFACPVGQSLFGTNDFVTTGCVGTAGPFACASASADQFTYREDHRAVASPLDPRIWTGSCRPGSDGCQPDEDYAAVAPAVARPQVWTGTCRAGGSDCTPEEELVVPAPSAASPRVYSGPCRAGGSDCVPDEDILAIAPAPATYPANASVTDEYRWDFPAVTSTFLADQFTYREDHRASASARMASLLLDPTRCDCFA